MTLDILDVTFLFIKFAAKSSDFQHLLSFTFKSDRSNQRPADTIPYHAAPGPHTNCTWSWVHCRGKPTDIAGCSAPGWCSLSNTSGQTGCDHCSASSTGLSPPRRACHPPRCGSSFDGCTRYPPAAPASPAAYPHLRDWRQSERTAPASEQNNSIQGSVPNFV